MTIYLVIVDSKVSQVAYKTLEGAQKFVRNRCKTNDLNNQPPYYKVFSTRDYSWYTITDAIVEEK